MSDLTHFDEAGRPRMVDVSAKSMTLREARARGRVRMEQATLDHLLGGAAKGDVVAVATLAGIMAAKRTGELIPLCHPLGLDAVEVQVLPEPGLPGLTVTATTRTRAPTGVEMEAMTAVSVACLTIYDMLKAIDRGMTIEKVELVAKSGGASGEWRREG
jgi:cyclic pyranopterin phosphate synthase